MTDKKPIFQLIASDINGYGGLGVENQGAKNDYYYHLESTEAKKWFIFEYAYSIYNVLLRPEDVFRIYKFIEGDYNNSNARYWAFEELAESHGAIHFICTG